MIVSIVWVLFLIGSTVLSVRLSQTPTQQAAANAASYMEELARKGTGLNAPLRATGVTYFYTPDGYRAVVTDPVSNNKFTLFLQNGTNEACCLAFPFGDCADTGVAECK